VALAAPSLAADAAVVLHRQRLAHERRQAGVAVVRTLLARGAELGMELVRAGLAWLHAERPLSSLIPERDLRVADIDDAATAGRTYAASLQIIFDEGHAVLTAAGEVESALMVFLYEAEKADEWPANRWKGGPALEALELQLDAWRAAARNVAREQL
jgi:hypothetical protein